MGHSGAVKAVHFGPQLPEKVIADRLRRQFGERGAIYPLHYKQHRAVAGFDNPFDTGDTDTSSLGRHADEGLVFDSADHRGSGPRVADVAQPGKPVQAVEQVRVTLVRAQCLDEEPPPVITDRHERPGTFRPDSRRLDNGGWQASGLQRLRDPVGSHPSIGHTECDQYAGAHRYPDGQREKQFGRQYSSS